MVGKVPEHVGATHEGAAPDVIDRQRPPPHEAVDARERHPQRRGQLAEGDEVHVGALEQGTGGGDRVTRHGRIVLVTK